MSILSLAMLWLAHHTVNVVSRGITANPNGLSIFRVPVKSITTPLKQMQKQAKVLPEFGFVSSGFQLRPDSMAWWPMA